MNNRSTARATLFRIIFAIIWLSTLTTAAVANAATISWNTDQSGDWGTASNWSGGVVPGPADDVIIDRPGANPTITISFGGWAIRSITCAENFSITAGSLTVTGVSQVTGNFLLSVGKLIVQSASGSFSAFGPTSVDNGRFEVSGGALVSLPNATQYVTIHAAYLTTPMPIVIVKDAGSRLEMPSVTQLQVGIASFYYSPEQLYEAKDGGIINWSGVTTISAPTADPDDYSRFRIRNGGQINFSGLQTVSSPTIIFDSDQSSISLPSLTSWAGAFQYGSAATVSLPGLTQLTGTSIFNVGPGQTYNLPALTQGVGASFVVEAGGVVNAPNLTSFTLGLLDLRGSAQFNSGMLTDIANSRFYISGGNVFNRIAATQYVTTAIDHLTNPMPIVTVKDAGSRLEMPSVQQMQVGKGGFYSLEQTFEAKDGGIINWSGVTTISAPTAEPDDYSRFRIRNGGQINFSGLQTVSSPTIIFDSDQSSISLPSLTSWAGAFQYGSAATVSLPGLTQLTGTSIFNVGPGQTYNLPALTQGVGASFVVEAGGVVNAPNLTSFTLGLLDLRGSAQFNSGMLTDITNSRFYISGGNVFNRIAATQYVTTAIDYLTNPMPIVTVKDAGSRLEMPSVQQMQVGKGGFYSLEQTFEAKDGGIINWSGVTTISAPTAEPDDYSRFRIRNGGQINFSGLQTVSSPTIIFDSDQSSISLPSLTDFSGIVTVLPSQTYNLPSLSHVNLSLITVEAGGVVNAPNLTSFTLGLLDLRGSAQFNSGMLTDIANSRFYISGGNVFNRIAATQYVTTGAAYTTTPMPIVIVKDAGSRLEMPSVQQMQVGKGGFYSLEQTFEAKDGGIINWSGVTILTTPTAEVDDFSTFRASNNGQIQMGALPKIQARAIRLTALAGGLVDMHSVAEIAQGPSAVLADGVNAVVDLTALCTYDNTTITELNSGDVIHNGILQSTFTSVGIFGVRSVGQSAACTGNNCSTSSLFSVFPDGRCLRASANVTRANVQLDVDGLAVSPSFGVQGFELIHSATSGNITGSRLLNINYDTGVASNAGSTVLSSRVVRAAAFIGDSLFAIDTAANQLLQIVPSNGTISGAAVLLKVNGQPYDIGERADIAITRDNASIVSDENRLYLLDRASGEMALIFIDNQPVPGATLPEFSGLAFGNGATLSQFELFQLIVGGADGITKLTQSLIRSDVTQSIPGPVGFDAIRGDLGSVSTLDTTPPGPVPVTINPNGSGTTVQVSWTTYSEPLNGNDINHYVVYKSTSNFSNISQATQAGQTPSGVQTIQLSGLVRNQQIFVAVVAIDNANNVNPLVTPVAVTPIDTQPPAEVTSITVQSATNQAVLNWVGSTSNDVQYYRVYRNSLNVSGDIPAATHTFTLNGLNPATGYQVRISAVDQSNNESPGVFLTVSTLLGNPSGLVVTSAASGTVALSWNAVTPTNLVANYRIYAETTNFTSVVGKTVRRTVGNNETSTSLAGLTNGTTYYVAVTTVNVSGGEAVTVVTVPVTPQVDTAGPALSAPMVGGGPLTPGTTVVANSVLQITAVDPSGMSRVDFYIQTGATRTAIGQHVGAGPQFSRTWDLTNFPDGTYSVVFEAFDTIGNMSTVTIPVTVAYAPPPAPVITNPVSGVTVAQTTLLVQGSATPGTSAGIFRDGVPLTGPLNVSGSGGFSASVTLVPGQNNLRAVCLGRGGVSAPSAPVTVTLDQSLPAAPNGVTGTSLEGGEIRINWGAVSSSSPLKYDVYRSTAPFTQISQATKVNQTALTVTTYVDLPPADGSYFYRVVAVNIAGTAGTPSSQINVNSDRTAPTVTSVTYSSTGIVHPTLGTFAPGFITATVTLSEPLAFAPFFSVAPNGGTPIVINLISNTPTQYTGVFEITAETLSGTAYALFSGRDQAGNHGTEIIQGQTLQIDTDGPAITTLTLQPEAPIQTTSSNPATIVFTAVLDDVPAPATTPAISYKLSAPGRQPVPVVNLAAVGGNRTIWSGSFTLPGDAGAPEPETLSFELNTVDGLGNIGDRVLAANAFQVFQGNLPPLPIPFGLTAVARPGGAVELAWNSVNGAAGYQLFRQAPSTTQLLPLGGVLTGTSFTDPTPVDGVYQYAVASVRQSGSLQSVSSPSIAVSVTADRVPPNAPQSLSLQMIGAGVRADWMLPSGGSGSGSELHYALYRANLPPSAPLNPTGLTPIINNIIGVAALDSAPSEFEHSYAVVALDQAGNASSPSNTVYLNFSLLPVSSFSIERAPNQYPELTWSYSGSAAANFKLEILQSGVWQTVQQGPGLTFTDQGYASGERRYRVTALDINSAASAPRELFLPAIAVQFPNPLTISRGVFNRLPFVVVNNGNSAVSNAKLRVVVDGRVHFGTPFSIPANGSAPASVVIGGYEDLAALEDITATVEIAPNPGELVELSDYNAASVSGSSLIVDIETEDLTYGSQGRMRFNITNTSDVVTELITAQANGTQPSDDIEFRLLDEQSNVLVVRPLKEYLGSSVITLSNGTTVARIQPGNTFTSEWVSIPVPTSAPVTSQAVVIIDKFHYSVGTPEHIEIAGLGANRSVTLVEAPYSGQINSITPTSTYDGVITVQGQSIDSQSNLPLAFQPLSLVLQTGGFETIENVTTDNSGSFSFEVNSQNFAAGSYVVSAVFPGSYERPNQGTFVINGISTSVSVANVNVPKNYTASIPIVVSASQGTAATGVAFRYDAADQPNNSLTPGLVVTLPAAANIGSGQSHSFNIQFGGQSNAPDQGSFVLGLMSNETGASPIRTVTVNYTFSAASAAVTFTPTTIDTGVQYNHTNNQSITIRNSGLAPLLDADVQLLKQDLTPVPDWVYSSSVMSFDRLEVNEERQIDLFFNPDNSVTEGYYNFVLRVVAPGQPSRSLPIRIAVTQSGQGGIVVHASDIYTGTLGENNQLVLGLEGAHIRLENEALITTIANEYTDSFGEVYFPAVVPGLYRVRASAPGHSDVSALLTVYPGATTPLEIFLPNNLITVEWSVTEITIQDYYQINLLATFQTNVPAAVVVLTPSSIDLPTMQQGQVLNGELTLTNHGLIGAYDLQQHLPASSPLVQLEFLTSIPPVLAPNQSITIPYRLTALQDFSPATGSGDSGADGICGFSLGFCITSRFVCANGNIFDGSTCTGWFYTRGCSLSGGNPGGWWSFPGLGETPGSSNSQSSTPNPRCVPGTNCSGEAGSPAM